MRVVLALAFLVLSASCARDVEQNAEFFVFGTIVEVKLWGVSESDASQAFSELQKMFQGMHRDWHAWELGRLTDINQAFADGRVANADEAIVEMVLRSQIIEEKRAQITKKTDILSMPVNTFFELLINES